LAQLRAHLLPDDDAPSDSINNPNHERLLECGNFALSHISDVGSFTNEFVNVPILGHVLLAHEALTNIAEWAKNKKPGDLLANSLFSDQDRLLQNTNTIAYFKTRAWKKAAGNFASLAGSGLSTFTQVNAVGAARHLTADTKKIVHLKALDQMINAYKSKNLMQACALCALIIDCKILKIESQTAALVADCIPGNVVSGIVTTAASILHAKSLELRLSKMQENIEKAAQLLHYRAFQGLKDGNEPPALEMVREIYTQLERVMVEKAANQFANK
jgi:hypothetical protein